MIRRWRAWNPLACAITALRLTHCTTFTAWFQMRTSSIEHACRPKGYISCENFTISKGVGGRCIQITSRCWVSWEFVNRIRSVWFDVLCEFILAPLLMNGWPKFSRVRGSSRRRLQLSHNLVSFWFSSFTTRGKNHNIMRGYSICWKWGDKPDKKYLDSRTTFRDWAQEKRLPEAFWGWIWKE